jgi:isopenicillin N synthase-like dioxygenase
MAPVASPETGNVPSDFIPIIDLGPYLKNEQIEETAIKLKDALERVGFFFIKGFESVVPWEKVAEVYEQAKKLHALPLESKGKKKFAGQTGGYLHLAGGTSFASKIAGGVPSAMFSRQKRKLPDLRVILWKE